MMDVATFHARPHASVVLHLTERWQTQLAGAGRVSGTDGPGSLKPLIDCVSAAPTFQNLCACVRTMRPGFSAIVETPEFVFACVDKIRSYPLFYSSAGGFLHVSNEPRRLLLASDGVDELSLLEFRMAGYVTGERTLYRNVQQLQAGECLLWKRGCSAVRRRYFCYLPTDDAEPSTEAVLCELAERTDAIFRRIVDRAGNRPVFVPLSGGLDSRLVLCKLREHGCRDLRSFSYGPPKNHEAATARAVATRLQVPWSHVNPDGAEIRGYFGSEQRRQYWQSADGLSVLPSMAEAVAFWKLMKEGRLPADALIVNGQSGDFITGAHIPPRLAGADASRGHLVEAIVAKHFALWADLATPEAVQRIGETVEESIRGLGAAEGIRGPIVASFYEAWEWQERQSKYVVNGQRLYDFLGLDWELPLWDEEYLWFWQGVPPDLRVGQALYRAYLRRYDYAGLFGTAAPAFRPRALPGWRYYPVQGLARLLALGGGERRASNRLKLYARYIGYYGPQYRAYPFRHFVRYAPYHRNANSFFVETWVKENLGLQCRP